VHGHWLLARLARLFPEPPFAKPARAALGRSLRAEAVAGEVRYLDGKGRASFERPYGLAWLLQLAAELRVWDDPDARRWSAALEPLERESAARIASWLPKLANPIRIGEHSQTAFSFGLILDWARTAHDGAMERLLEARARAFYGGDTRCPLSYEPSGEDFLSPCLAEADLMRRVLPREELAPWVSAFLPALGAGDDPLLQVPTVLDRTDGKAVHLFGLALSRAWQLRLLAPHLGPDAQERIAKAAEEQASAVEREIVEGDFMSTHWLVSFALLALQGVAEIIKKYGFLQGRVPASEFEKKAHGVS